MGRISISSSQTPYQKHESVLKNYVFNNSVSNSAETKLLVSAIEWMLAQKSVATVLDSGYDVEALDDDAMGILEFRKNFKDSLKKGQIGYLRLFYNIERLRDIKPENRKIVCECLIEDAIAKSAEPNPDWIKMANGQIGE